MRIKEKHIKIIISLSLHINVTDLGTRNMILNNKNFNSKSQSATSLQFCFDVETNLYPEASAEGYKGSRDIKT